MPNDGPASGGGSGEAPWPDEAAWGPVSGACLSWGALEKLGGVSEEQYPQEVAAHVAGCARCRAVLSQVRANTSVSKLLAEVIGERGGEGGGAGASVDGGLGRDLVPGYEIVEELHRGGQGVVYRAVQQGTRREVAIKMLLAGVFATPKQRQRFELEAEIAGQLRHPGIVTVHEIVSLKGGRLALVMEMVRGQRIDAWAAAPATGGPGQRLRELLGVFATICDAVAHAHRAGVIHRDLKPSNILVSDQGNACVLDFGLARLSSTDRQLTMTGDAAWTLAYAAPEQIDDPRLADVRSDVYALGVVLYQMLAGRMPYDTTDCPLPVAMQRIRTQVPELSTLREQLGGQAPAADVAAVVMHALEKQPGERYQSVEALGADVRALGAGEVVSAPTLGAMYRARKAARKHWKLLAIAGLVMAGVGIPGRAWLAARERAASADVARSLERERAQLAAQTSAGVRLLVFELAGPTRMALGQDETLPQRRAMDALILQLDMGLLRGQERTDAAARRLLGVLYAAHGLHEAAERQQARTIYLLERAQAVQPVSVVTHDGEVLRARLDMLKSLIAMGLPERFAEEEAATWAVLDCHPLELAGLRAEASELSAEAALVFAKDVERARAKLIEARQAWGAAGVDDSRRVKRVALEALLLRTAGDEAGSAREAEAVLQEAVRMGADGADDLLRAVALLQDVEGVDGRFTPLREFSKNLAWSTGSPKYAERRGWWEQVVWESTSGDSVERARVLMQLAHRMANYGLRESAGGAALHSELMLYAADRSDAEGFSAIAQRQVHWLRSLGRWEAGESWFRLLLEQAEGAPAGVVGGWAALGGVPARDLLVGGDLLAGGGKLAHARVVYEFAQRRERAYLGRDGLVCGQAALALAIVDWVEAPAGTPLVLPEQVPEGVRRGVVYRFWETLLASAGSGGGVSREQLAQLNAAVTEMAGSALHLAALGRAMEQARALPNRELWACLQQVEARCTVPTGEVIERSVRRE